ncbi:hypothetical protein [Nonomuraea endophytica]|uniref:hypothetical protein n=1 Tax=Nonomuraea endophytica TaxID=714136 RepID=UPI0037CA4018
MESPRWAARIRAERKDRLWDTHSMARRLREAAGENGRDLPDHEALVRSIRRWESGKIAALSERYRLLFCRTFGLSEADLFNPDGREPVAVPCSCLPPTDCHDLEAIASFRGADRQVGGGHLYATVLGYLERDVAPRLFGGSDGTSTSVAAAAFTEMAGWMAHDAGQDDTADRHFSRALDLAGVGGDRQLEAHILGSKSHLARHLGRADDAVRLAHRGATMLTETRTAAPAMKARLLSMGARGFATLGDSVECTRLLMQAEEILAQPEEVRSAWAGPFDHGTLSLDAARSFLALTQFTPARRHAAQAVALRPPERTRSRAFGQLVLANVLLEMGEVGEACGILTQVIEDTRSLSSLVVTRQLADLREQLKAYRGDEIAADILAALEEALRDRRWLYQWRGSQCEPGNPPLRT